MSTPVGADPDVVGPRLAAVAFRTFAAIIAGIVARSAAGAMAGEDTAGTPTASTPAWSWDAPHSRTVRSRVGSRP